MLAPPITRWFTCIRNDGRFTGLNPVTKVKDVMAMELNPYADEFINGPDSNGGYSVVQLGSGSPASLIRSVQEWALMHMKSSELQAAYDQYDSAEPVEGWSRDELFERLAIANDVRDNTRIRLIAGRKISVFQASTDGVIESATASRLIDVMLNPVELQITPEHGYVFVGVTACNEGRSGCSPSHIHEVYTVNIDWWGTPNRLVVTVADCQAM